MMCAGAGGTQYGVLTSVNQGGGDKKQGLVSTTNSPVALDSHIRVRGGGHNRNLLFCMNQLGGVGRRWGQASGPGNRGGVSANCQRLAYRRRLQYPPKPCGAGTRGWGAGTKFKADCRVAAAPAPPVVFSGFVYGPVLNPYGYQCDGTGGCVACTQQANPAGCVAHPSCQVCNPKTGSCAGICSPPGYAAQATTGAGGTRGYQMAPTIEGAQPYIQLKVAGPISCSRWCDPSVWEYAPDAAQPPPSQAGYPAMNPRDPTIYGAKCDGQDSNYCYVPLPENCATKYSQGRTIAHPTGFSPFYQNQPDQPTCEQCDENWQPLRDGTGASGLQTQGAYVVDPQSCPNFGGQSKGKWGLIDAPGEQCDQTTTDPRNCSLVPVSGFTSSAKQQTSDGPCPVGTASVIYKPGSGKDTKQWDSWNSFVSPPGVQPEIRCGAYVDALTLPIASRCCLDDSNTQAENAIRFPQWTSAAGSPSNMCGLAEASGQSTALFDGQTVGERICVDLSTGFKFDDNYSVLTGADGDASHAWLAPYDVPFPADAHTDCEDMCAADSANCDTGTTGMQCGCNYTACRVCPLWSGGGPFQAPKAGLPFDKVCPLSPGQNIGAFCHGDTTECDAPTASGSGSCSSGSPLGVCAMWGGVWNMMHADEGGCAVTKAGPANGCYSSQ